MGACLCKKVSTTATARSLNPPPTWIRTSSTASAVRLPEDEVILKQVLTETPRSSAIYKNEPIIFTPGFGLVNRSDECSINRSFSVVEMVMLTQGTSPERRPLRELSGGEVGVPLSESLCSGEFPSRKYARRDGGERIGSSTIRERSRLRPQAVNSSSGAGEVGDTRARGLSVGLFPVPKRDVRQIGSSNRLIVPRASGGGQRLSGERCHLTGGPKTSSEMHALGD
ncbi:unnamed protein product [Spirodela intermedia]|uniref:Uncharacterized protein n=1 Tax=Spirodela intermedia TaxID=51605 RepID=A0A7I8JPK8_SPIIN|nr:unnamed protein product [Spirodela intermedia]CAA6672050.1 unnamed protein product [Spirodela intermedia]